LKFGHYECLGVDSIEVISIGHFSKISRLPMFWFVLLVSKILDRYGDALHRKRIAWLRSCAGTKPTRARRVLRRLQALLVLSLRKWLKEEELLAAQKAIELKKLFDELGYDFDVKTRVVKKRDG